MKQGKDIQPVLIGMRGLNNIEGHCIFVMNGQIVDGLYIMSMPLEKENLDYVLRENVTEVAFCYILYPNRNFIIELIHIESYKKIQNRKRKEKEESVKFLG